MKKYLLPKTGNFYKANLHAHTDMSDGRNTPEEVTKTITFAELEASGILSISNIASTGEPHWGNNFAP